MAEIVWSNQGLEDLDNIAEYIARDSTYFASLTVEKILELTEALVQFPQIGRMVPEFEMESIRELIYKSYRIIYELRSDRIEILTMIHSSRAL